MEAGEYQAICLLNAEQHHNSQQQQHVQQVIPSTGTTTDVSSSQSSSTSQQQQHDGLTTTRPHHQHRLAHDGTFTSAASTTFQNSAPENITNNSNFQRASGTHQQLATGTPSNIIGATTTPLTKSVLRLTVSKGSSSSAAVAAESDTTTNKTPPTHVERNPMNYTSQPLTFRPLAPCVSQLLVAPCIPTVVTTDDESGHNKRVNHSNDMFLITGVWVGSADDNLLRLFLPTDDDAVAALEEMRLDHAGFVFQSPVMALH